MVRYAIILICLVAQLAQGQEYFRRRPAPASGAVVDGHWVDPWDYVFLLDGQSLTNVSNSARGSLGSAFDNGVTSGVPTAGCITNMPNTGTGPLWGGDLVGTNSLGDIVRPWFFDGADDFIKVTNRLAYSFGSDDGLTEQAHTIYAWIWTSNSVGLTIASYGGVGSVNNGQWFVDLQNGALSYYTAASNLWTTAACLRRWTIAGNKPMYSNQWTFITIVNDGSGTTNAPTFYTNGILANRTSTAFGAGYTAMTNSRHPLVVGGKGQAGGSKWNGYITDFGVIKSALSSAQVWTVYQQLGNIYGPTGGIRKATPAGSYPP